MTENLPAPIKWNDIFCMCLTCKNICNKGYYHNKAYFCNNCYNKRPDNDPIKSHLIPFDSTSTYSSLYINKILYSTQSASHDKRNVTILLNSFDEENRIYEVDFITTNFNVCILNLLTGKINNYKDKIPIITPGQLIDFHLFTIRVDDNYIDPRI